MCERDKPPAAASASSMAALTVLKIFSPAAASPAGASAKEAMIDYCFGASRLGWVQCLQFTKRLEIGVSAEGSAH